MDGVYVGPDANQHKSVFELVSESQNHIKIDYYIETKSKNEKTIPQLAR